MSQRDDVVYLSLGSSGDTWVTDRVLNTLHEMGLTSIVSSAGRYTHTPQDNCFIADYLPGVQAARLARFMVGNGGSASAYQSFATGTPLIGIPSNMDQYLTMEGVEQCGAGIMLRAGRLKAAQLRKTMQQVWVDPVYRQRAELLAAEMKALDSRTEFRKFIDSVV
ncbi:MAG: hypothetical protein KZQ58_04180 [gamma proteobacterium symbiont of Bathyaustriella thionipta]|nr:hypothetical protein [gamma proteobacterium symbiont of Bathyaustriella thionipta]